MPRHKSTKSTPQQNSWRIQSLNEDNAFLDVPLALQQFQNNNLVEGGGRGPTNALPGGTVAASTNRIINEFFLGGQHGSTAGGMRSAATAETTASTTKKGNNKSSSIGKKRKRKKNIDEKKKKAGEEGEEASLSSDDESAEEEGEESEGGNALSSHLRGSSSSSSLQGEHLFSRYNQRLSLAKVFQREAVQQQMEEEGRVGGRRKGDVDFNNTSSCSFLSFSQTAPSRYPPHILCSVCSNRARYQCAECTIRNRVGRAGGKGRMLLVSQSNNSSPSRGAAASALSDPTICYSFVCSKECFAIHKDTRCNKFVV